MISTLDAKFDDSSSLTCRSFFPWKMECHYCGFEPPDLFDKPDKCPKCGGSAWRQLAVPGALAPQRSIWLRHLHLEQAGRYRHGRHAVQAA